MLQLVSRTVALFRSIACFSFLATQRPIPVIQPCNPSPCGINAECTERNRAASCKCIRDYIGNPYVECKPECITNNECPRDKACVNQHCVDPCPGVCGAHATCQANNHRALCRCDPGYTGDAFVSCSRITTRKFLERCCLGMIWRNYFQLRQESHNDQILATHRHVVLMLFALTEMVLQLVNVFKITSATHM